jgi:hypothetical protein
VKDEVWEDKNGEEGANKTDSFVKREVCSQHDTQIRKYAVDVSFGLLNTCLLPELLLYTFYLFRR